MNSMDDLVLAAFLREDDFYSKYGSVVDDSMFEETPHKICINAYIEYVKRYSRRPSPEEMTLEVQRYCRRFSFNSDIESQAQVVVVRCFDLTYNIDYVRDSFIRFATKNKLTSTILSAAKIIHDKGDELTEKDYSKIQDSMTEALSIKARDVSGVFLDEVAEDPAKYFKDHSRFDTTRVVRTGIRSFDRAHIAGGPVPGELYVVSAPPGKGKSTFLVNVGTSALMQGLDTVHIFIGDNTEADGILRYCSRLTGVSMSQIMLNSNQYLPAWKQLNENFNLGKILIGAFATNAPTIADIRSFITRSMSRREFDPKLVIVDYIDNCRRDPNLNSYEALGDLYSQLKNMAEEMELVVWTASQVKIEYWNSDQVGLASLSDSSKKQAIVDGLINMIVAPSGTSCKLDVAKYRRGAAGLSLEMTLDYERMLLKESLPGRSTSVVPNMTAVSSASSSSPVIPPSPYNNGQ